MERQPPDRARLSALRAKDRPDVALALSSTTLGGVPRRRQRTPMTHNPSLPTTTLQQTGHQKVPSTTAASRPHPPGGRSGKNFYCSLNSALAQPGRHSTINYTISEDASGENVLSKLSRLLAILDETVLENLISFNMHSLNKTAAQEDFHDHAPAERYIPRIEQTIPAGTSPSEGFGFPLYGCQALDALQAAVVMKKQVLLISSGFTKFATSKDIYIPRFGRVDSSSTLTRRQFWYLVSNQYPKLSVRNLRLAQEFINSNRQPERLGGNIEHRDYLYIVVHLLYGVNIFSHIEHALAAVVNSPNDHMEIKVSELLKLIASVKTPKSRAKLERMVYKMDFFKTGSIDYGDWAAYIFGDII